MNTAGLVKALCEDMAMDRLDIHSTVDLQLAIQELCTQPYMLQALRYFVLYLYGYTAEEIGIRFYLTTQEVEAYLTTFIIALAEQSGYTDESILRRVPKRRQTFAQSYLLHTTHAFSYNE